MPVAALACAAALAASDCHDSRGPTAASGGSPYVSIAQITGRHGFQPAIVGDKMNANRVHRVAAPHEHRAERLLGLVGVQARGVSSFGQPSAAARRRQLT